MARISVDAQLLHRFRDGDPDAVREVYRLFAGPMTTVARSILVDNGLAADAVQQAFLQAWRASSTYDPQRPLSTWLYAITRRVCVDLYRRQRAHVQLTDTGDLTSIAPRDDHVEREERLWQAWEVRTALEELAPDEREVVRLTHFDGLTLVQAAEHLGVPVGTVKSRSHRAHRRLADRLGHLRAKTA
jgi:RNA polymerase sigma-70 factor, ECF subfamily